MRTSTNPELIAAWATVPDVAKAQERYDAVVKLRRDFPRGATPEEALTGVQDAAIATFTRTGTWPTDFARKASKAHADAVVWHAEIVALRRAEDALKFAAEDARDSMAPDVLAHLDGRLTEILSAAKDASTALGDITTAEQAIGAGSDALDAWRRLTGLLSDFRNARDAQASVLRAVSNSDEQARMRQWLAQGHGEVRGVRLDDVPEHIRSVMRSHAYTIEYLVWLAQSGAGYVPKSYDDLAADVEASTEPLAYDDFGPLHDMSPRVTPIPTPQPAKVFAHSSTPNLDDSQPRPPKPEANAVVSDPKPPTYSY